MQNTVNHIRYAELHHRRQRALEKEFVPRIFNAIKQQYAAAIRDLRANGVYHLKANLHSIIHFEPIARVIKKLYVQAGYVESQFVGSYIKRKATKKFRTFGVSLDDLAPVIEQYFQIHLLNQSALPITETTRKIIIRHLVSEVDNGVPLEEAIANFTDLAVTGGAPTALRRAVMIARTESTKAMSIGGLIGAYMTGVDVDKLWVTSDDEKVRQAPYSHRSLDMSEASLFDGFYNGESIRFPGDPNASPANTINCRCALLFVEKENPSEPTDRNITDFLIDMALNGF